VHILIIDDEPKIRKGLERLLSQHERWSVAAFPDAPSALRHLYENEVDAVITDIQMPEVSGLDMIEKLRKVNREIPVLILSGYSRFDYAQRAIELGVRKYLTKPTDPQELVDALEEIERELDARADRIREKVEDPEKGEIRNLLVLRAVEYLEEHYAGHVSLGEVAGALYISPNYLSELFGRTMGVRFSEYLLKVRMEKSKTYLADARYKISDVTQLVGFTDARYFSSTFKKLYQMTPMEYRNRYAGRSEAEKAEHL
jgi:two-component system response regulator YesN